MAAQFQQVCAAGTRLVFVQRFDQEVGGAGFERVITDLAVVDHGDHNHRHVHAMRQRTQLLDQLDAVELWQLVVGEYDVDAVVAGELECAGRGVEEFEIEAAIDLPDDLRQQQPAGKQVVDDHHGIALGTRKASSEMVPPLAPGPDARCWAGLIRAISSGSVTWNTVRRLDG